MGSGEGGRSLPVIFLRVLWAWPYATLLSCSCPGSLAGSPTQGPKLRPETLNEVVLPLFQGRTSGPATGGFLLSGPLGSPRAMKIVGQLPQVGACSRAFMPECSGCAVPWLPSIGPVFRPDPQSSHHCLSAPSFSSKAVFHLLHLLASRLPELVAGVREQRQSQCLITTAPQRGGAHSAHIPRQPRDHQRAAAVRRGRGSPGVPAQLSQHQRCPRPPCPHGQRAWPSSSRSRAACWDSLHGSLRVFSLAGQQPARGCPLGVGLTGQQAQVKLAVGSGGASPQAAEKAPVAIIRAAV